MAPAKRKQSDAAPAPKAKRMTAKEPAQPAAEVLPEHQPLVALLDEARDLDCVGQGSRDMLQMSLRSAFAKPKLQRHDFQNKVLSLFDKVVSDTEAKLRQMLASAEEKVKAIAADKEAASTLSKELKEGIASKTNEADVATKVLATAVSLAESAQKELDSALEREEELASTHAAKQAEKERFETISEQWQSLTQVPEPGVKAAKARSKEVEAFMEVFAELPVEQSLIDGLPLALKSKTRGAFTETLLAHSEQAVEAHLKALEEQVAEGDKEAEETRAVVAAARSQLEASEKERDTCQNAVKSAASEEAALLRRKTEADFCVKGADKNAEICASEVERLEQKLEQFTNLLVKYGELRDGPAATADGPVATDGPAGARSSS